MLSINLTENNGAAPEAVPYMPPGEHSIAATRDGKPERLTVRVDAAACQRLQSDLAEQLAAYEAGEKARPVIMFDHNKSGNAAATPIAFEWDPKRGILLRVEWTQAGREAVEGGNYGYISPAFRAEDDGTITGLTGGVEVGSLVNDPAFEKNACILASKQELPPLANLDNKDKKDDNKNVAKDGDINQKNKIMEDIKKALGLPPEADDDAVLAAINALKEKAAGADESKKQLEEIKAANADEFIKRKTADGTISPHDSAKIEAARAMHIENAARAELIFNGMRSVDAVPKPTGAHVNASKVNVPTKTVREILTEEINNLK